MKANLTIGAVWEDREDGKQFELVAVRESDGKVQISPLHGGEFRIMGEKSLRSNYKLIALKRDKVAEPEPKTTPEPEPAPVQDGKKERKPAGRVMLENGNVIPGAHFITKVAGKTREETYKVDSPIRWLLKPEGQALLEEFNSSIVYGQPLTK